MDHSEFMSQLHGPRFVWLMATGAVHPWTGRNDQRPLTRSARTRAANARAAIDRLVLARARRICQEHDHGAWASCNWLCDLTQEQRDLYRQTIRAEPLLTNERVEEIKRQVMSG